ncbi:MAG: PLP-dependent aminotransferase family protein [Firmicutes bacterium]|nr:PLP-dependent aminotransferase family protein [Bacillota bacterium]
MNYSIDIRSKTPAYLQLYNLLKKDITAGIYPYGVKLPSKRVTADETGVSVITVEHAMQLLAEEGYIESREKSGYFVSYREKDFQGIAASAASDVSEGKAASSLHKSEFPYSVLAKNMRRALANYGPQILEKSPNSGLLVLREAICSYLARSRAMEVQPQQVIIGSGAEYLYSLIAQLFGGRRVFALEDPSYAKIRDVYEAYGIKCDMLKLTRSGIDSAALKKTKAKLLHTTPFNSYPSGVTVSVSKKKEYLRWAQERGGVIIEDNYDSELTVSHKAEDSLFAMSEGKNVVYLNTFSHTIAPSVRIGYMILPKDMTGDFEKKLGFYSCTVPVFEQYVLTDMINSGDFERHINRVRRRKRKELQL